MGRNENDCPPIIDITPAMLLAGIAALDDELLEGYAIEAFREELVRHVYRDMVAASRVAEP